MRLRRSRASERARVRRQVDRSGTAVLVFRLVLLVALAFLLSGALRVYIQGVMPRAEEGVARMVLPAAFLTGIIGALIAAFRTVRRIYRSFEK